MSTWTTAIDPTDSFPITCDACAEAKCSVCGHEPCPACVDCCDHTDCLEKTEEGPHGNLKKTHECVFTACPEHRPS